MTSPVYTDLSSLNALRGPATAERGGYEDRLEEAAKQFSAVFLQMALKSMRDANLGEGAMDSKQSEFYRDMFDKQLALELSSDKSVGITQLIVDQLTALEQFDTTQATGQPADKLQSPAQTTQGPVETLKLE